MVKLQDFAVECGVTDRQIQRLVKKYESELNGHFIRRGSNGTWLDDDACRILRSKMKVKEVVVSDEAADDLRSQIEELQKRIDMKDLIIEKLQNREMQKDTRIEELEQIQLQIEGKKQEEINIAVSKAKEELQQDLDQKHGKVIEELNEKHDAAVLDLQNQLQEEKTRKLSWRERIRGRKG